MIPLIDEPCWTPHRKILTPAQTQLPWLCSFGIQTSEKAEKPLAPHVHPNCMEIVFLLKGFQLYETAGHLFRLTGYDIFVTRTGEPHSSCNFPEHISDLIWFQIRLSALSQTFRSPKASELARALHGLPRIFRGNAALESQLREAFFLPCIPRSDHAFDGAGAVCRLPLPSHPAFPRPKAPSGGSDQRIHRLYPRAYRRTDLSGKRRRKLRAFPVPFQGKIQGRDRDHSPRLYQLCQNRTLQAASSGGLFGYAGFGHALF